MGISDEDYAKALKLQRAFELQQMKKELQKQKEEAKMSILSSLGNIIGGGGGGMNPHHQQAIQPGAYQSVAAQQAGTGTVHISHGGTTTTFTGGPTGVTLNNIAHPIGLKVITEENLKHDAMIAPLSALVDMWTMRWQGNWVNEAEFDEDDFWRLALVRLLGASKLEKHNLADQHRSVYRIIE